MVLVSTSTAPIPRLNSYRDHLDYIGVESTSRSNFLVPKFDFKVEPLNCLSSCCGLDVTRSFYNQPSRDTHKRC